VVAGSVARLLPLVVAVGLASSVASAQDVPAASDAGGTAELVAPEAVAPEAPAAAPAEAPVAPAPPPEAAPAPEPPRVEPAVASTGSGVATGAGTYRADPEGVTAWAYRGVSLLGVFAFIGVGWVLSENRGAVRWRTVLWGVGLQLAFGAVVLGLGASAYIYDAVNYLVGVLLGFSEAGAAFVFASFIPHQTDVIGPDGFAPVTYGLARDDVANWPPATRNVAFAVLPTIIFFSALMSLLYYLGVMSPIVKGIAWLMVRTLGTSGAESLSAAGNIFVGQTEAPLLVRPFIGGMTRSELMAVMTGGFATVAGGVLGVYVMLLQDALPSIAGHLVVASILSAPAALAMAKVMVPETATSLTAGDVKVHFEQPSSNFIEAAANGATDGMKLLLNVVAMLIAIVALVAMANWAISLIPVGVCADGAIGFGYAVACDGGGVGRSIDLSMIFGFLFFPAAMLMGVPVEDWIVVGELLGEKIVLTELLAYKSLAGLVSGTEPVISQRAAIIASYALCGFANFASIGIQLGGIGGMAPERMGELAQLGFRAMFAGALAACMTGAVAGVFL
jgi:CNT family concentrative nucleoside transporter